MPIIRDVVAEAERPVMPRPPVARAWSLHYGRIDGSPLDCNRADVCRPDVPIGRPEHAARMLREVA